MGRGEVKIAGEMGIWGSGQDALIALNVEATLRDDHYGRAGFLVGEWNRVVPAGVALGCALFAEGWYERKGQSQSSFQEVLVELGARVIRQDAC